ncbi:Metallo-dependent phosphatase [Viridothelium virens]|uniref:Metallo-dependent phosphatase n=1 Tax=Viridothelium virens TaxID=1048519 RepID=A0A6A6HD06_VIRVR|nr:Metallo-dependent phosphatase [Viridothelium virens]
MGKDRLIFVGDVHGCADELSALLTKLSFSTTSDHLIFTGDLITKGPESSAVLSTAMSLGASSVRGNHEDRVLLSLAHLEEYASPPSQKEDKHTRLARDLPASQIEYIQSFPVILDVGMIPGLGRVLVVHAGLVPDVPLQKQDPFMCMNMRSIDLSTHFASELRAAPGRRNMNGGLVEWDRVWRYYERKAREEWEGHTMVIYGHDSKRGLNLREWSKGLDSGCVNGGTLTALVVEKVAKDGKGKERAKIWTESVQCQSSKKKKGKDSKDRDEDDREISSAEQAWEPRIPGT